MVKHKNKLILLVVCVIIPLSIYRLFFTSDIITVSNAQMERWMSQDSITMYIDFEHERPFVSLMTAFGDNIKFINNTDYYFFFHALNIHLFVPNGTRWEKINYDPDRFRVFIYWVLTPQSYLYIRGMNISPRHVRGEYRIVFDMFGPFPSGVAYRDIWDTVPLRVVGAFTT